MTQEQFLQELLSATKRFSIRWTPKLVVPVFTDFPNPHVVENRCDTLEWNDITLERETVTINDLVFSYRSEESRNLVRQIFDFVLKEENAYEAGLLFSFRKDKKND